MKYLVVSDIHGALSGAEAIKNAYDFHTPDYILCLGDILYHGPRNDLPLDYAPKKVIPIMNDFKTKLICVKGNCDGEVMTHGHTYTPSNPQALNTNDCFLSGHTHVPTAYQENGIYLLNPGSISLPKENHPRTYAILTDTDFTIYTLDHKEYMKIEF